MITIHGTHNGTNNWYQKNITLNVKQSAVIHIIEPLYTSKRFFVNN